MKRVIIIIILCFTFVFNVNSQNRVFISRLGIGDEIEILRSSSMDSLNNYIKSENLRNLAIYLRNLNEIQMDSMLILLDNPSLIDKIFIDSCPIKKLPIVFRKFYRLRDLRFQSCDSIESFNGLKSIQPTFALVFINCNITKLPDGIENINSILSISIMINKDFKSFNLEESLNKLTYRNNLRAFFIFDDNLMVIPKSLDKLTLLSHLYLVGNDKMKIDNKLYNLVNLVEFMSNIETKLILDEKIIANLSLPYLNLYKFYDINTKTEDGIYNLFRQIGRVIIEYYLDHFVFYKNDIFLSVKYMGMGYEYRCNPRVTRDIDTLKYEIIMDDNFFHIEKQFYVKTFLLKYLKLDSVKTAKVKFVHPYNDEEILSFELESGDEYLVNLENYKDIYFNIEFDIDGKKYIRNVEMK